MFFLLVFCCVFPGKCGSCHYKKHPKYWLSNIYGKWRCIHIYIYYYIYIYMYNLYICFSIWESDTPKSSPSWSFDPKCHLPSGTTASKLWPWGLGMIQRVTYNTVGKKKHGWNYPNSWRWMEDDFSPFPNLRVTYFRFQNVNFAGVYLSWVNEKNISSHLFKAFFSHELIWGCKLPAQWIHPGKKKMLANLWVPGIICSLLIPISPQENWKSSTMNRR